MLEVPSFSSHSSLLPPARVKTMEPTLVQFLNPQSGNQSDTQTSRGHPPPERARDSSNGRRKRPAKPHLLHTMWLWKHQHEEMRNWMKKGEIRVIGGRGRKWERQSAAMPNKNYQLPQARLRVVPGAGKPIKHPPPTSAKQNKPEWGKVWMKKGLKKNVLVRQSVS